MEICFLVLQAYILAFLLFHDWIPLGRLNNLPAMRREDSLGHRVFVTLLGAVPAGVGLYLCVRHLGEPYPHGLKLYLWITYGLFLLGLLRAWWIPYLIKPDPERAARYKIIFPDTHRFLPERNGIAPDTLHTPFHLAVVLVLVLLFFR